MTITIGRATIAEDPDTLRHQGDRLIVGGDIDATSSDEMKAIRAQLLGMIDNDDEDVFPLEWDQDSSHTGFYEVVNVTVDPYSTHLTTGLLRYEIELERIPNFVNPMFEMTTTAVVRPNGHSITSAECNAGSYVETTAGGEYRDYASTGNNGFLVQRGDTANNPSIWYATETAPFTGSRVAWRGEASNHYQLQCLIEQKRGSTWYEVVGRDVDWSDPTEWRISNGLLRVALNTSNNDYLDVSIFDWAGSASWETSTFRFGYDDGAGTFVECGYLATRPSSTAYQSIPVIRRNSPERVVLEFNGQNGAKSTLTLTVGDHHVVHRFTASTSRKWGMKFDAAYTPAAMATATVGIRDTSSDAAGNRKVAMGASAMTNDTVNAETYLTSAATSATFGLGIVLAGGSAASGNQAADLQAQFLGAPSIRRRVTSR